MKKSDLKYQTYLKILQEELRPAMGCTEPISLAYAAAVAKDLLGACPEKILIQASGSIIKNVKSVIVPNTGHLKGIPAAVAAGIIAGDSSKELEVIAKVSSAQIDAMQELLDTATFTVQHLESPHTFDLIVTLFHDDSHATVQITDDHTNIVFLQKDTKILKDVRATDACENSLSDRSLLNMEDIWDFTRTVDCRDVSELLDRQIAYNMAIANEGLNNNYGANIGKVLLSMGSDVRTKARAYAAAGSDARMNGCELPVIINSGSGNQGMATSIPVIVYAHELAVTDEQLYRALVLSNLTTIHQKTPIGRLSAYCGAVSAGAGAGAGIAYLHNGTYEDIIHTVVNAVSITSGIVCDGAKSSCAAKIAASVDAGILGFFMYRNGQQFYNGDGIVSNNIENTIRNVGQLASQGMKETNEEIIKIMINA